MLRITLVTLAIIACAYGQIADIGGCPEIPDPKLNFDKFFGRWYEIARIENFWEPGLRCVTFDFYPTPNGSIYFEIPVIQTGYDNDNLRYSRQTSADEFNVCENCNPKFFLLDGINYFVVDVDYDNYALVYSCNIPDRNPPFPYIPFRARFAWILSRKPELDAEITQDLTQKLIKLGIPARKIFFPKNEGCPNA